MDTLGLQPRVAYSLQISHHLEAAETFFYLSVHAAIPVLRRRPFGSIYSSESPCVKSLQASHTCIWKLNPRSTWLHQTGWEVSKQNHRVFFHPWLELASCGRSRVGSSAIWPQAICSKSLCWYTDASPALGRCGPFCSGTQEAAVEQGSRQRQALCQNHFVLHFSMWMFCVWLVRLAPGVVTEALALVT